MNTCPKCGKEYPDSENFCIDCGSKLEAAERHEEAHSDLRTEIERLSAQMTQLKKEFEGKHEEVSGAASTGISKLTGRLGTLEKRIYKQPEPAANEEFVSLASSVGELEKRMDELEKSVSGVRMPESLEAKISQLEKQVARAGKEALRVAKAKHMPDSEVMGIVSDMGELEDRIDKLEKKREKLPTSKLEPAASGRRFNSVERKLGLLEKGMKSFVSLLKDNDETINSLESRVHMLAKQSDIAADLRMAVAAEREKTEAKLAELSSLKGNMERSVARMENAAKRSTSIKAERVSGWIREAESRFAAREQVDSLLSDVEVRMDEKLKPLEKFREKVILITGHALEQQERFKALKSGTMSLVGRRLEQMESSVSKRLEQLGAKLDAAAATSSSSIDAMKSKLNGDVASLNESLSRVEEFENRLSGELETLKEAKAPRHDIEAMKELVESYNAKLSTFKQLLTKHAKSIDELSQMKEQIQADQERALDEMNARMNKAMHNIRLQGNAIVADIEKKMNDSIGAGLKSIEETKSRMEGEMKLVLDTLSRSQGFDKAVQSELAALKAEVGELDGRIKAAVSEEKGALDNAIKLELKKLQKTSRDAEQKLGLLKDSWGNAIKDNVRKSVDEFEEVRKAYSESLEKAKNIESYVNSLVDKAMRGINKKTGEEGRMNASLRKDLESALKETRITNKDSQEKLAMVKDFITNIESRFGSDIEGLNRRMDKLAKIQQKLELEGLSPRGKVK